jgi:hypothetical protein
VLLDVFWIGWGEKHTTFAMAARIYTGYLQYIVLFMCELPFFSFIGGQVLPHCSFIYLWFSKNGSGNTAAVHHFFLNLVQLHKSGTFQLVFRGVVLQVQMIIHGFNLFVHI